ncbi:ABC transporter ATP-binding protein [Levilactobacillus fuyuanensis]|uniref:ATP-binding cassette domain-containing protein n=1 Tax=Levilactobacillus fuyuanensis TaxID=2486022 RepID=A0ABW4H143_9LACO|nr:ATP-binding cassette domain-containing protein [Levilactobacillus fuyuanensis]
MTKSEKNLQAKRISFSYMTYEKNSGLLGSLHDFVHRRKRAVHAIHDISFSINSGEIVGLLGPNGAGKTTLIKLMTGILPVNEGKIDAFSGINPFEKSSAYLKRIGVMFGQKSQLIWDLPPIDTLIMLREIYQIPKPVFEKRLSFFTKQLAVSEQLQIPVRKLSLGQRIKFELICAIIHYPEILFLDEPTIGIDVSSQSNIYRFLREINKERKMTIILTSHNTKDIVALAQRVIIIAKGEKIFDGTPNALISEHASQQIIEVTTDSPIEPLPIDLIELGDCHYQFLSNDSAQLPIALAHILSLKRRDGDLDEILVGLFSKLEGKK